MKHIPELKECIKGTVKFQYYKSNELWYSTDNGFLFPVPLGDVGEATFLAEDKAMLFMRYIRKYRDVLLELSKAEEI